MKLFIIFLYLTPCLVLAQNFNEKYFISNYQIGNGLARVNEAQASNSLWQGEGRRLSLTFGFKDSHLQTIKNRLGTESLELKEGRALLSYYHQLNDQWGVTVIGRYSDRSSNQNSFLAESQHYFSSSVIFSTVTPQKTFYMFGVGNFNEFGKPRLMPVLGVRARFFNSKLSFSMMYPITTLLYHFNDQSEFGLFYQFDYGVYPYVSQTGNQSVTSLYYRMWAVGAIANLKLYQSFWISLKSAMTPVFQLVAQDNQFNLGNNQNRSESNHFFNSINLAYRF